MDPINVKVWTASKWKLNVEGREIPSFFLVNAGFTGPHGIRAPMVYVGRGGPRDFKKVDASGKIVVADVAFPFLPLGFLAGFLKLLHETYHVSNPDGSLGTFKRQYLNFVRPNFIGGSTIEDSREDDVYWNAYKAGAKGICLILKNQPSNSNSHYGPYDGIMKPMPGLWIGKYDGMVLREKAKRNVEATLVLDGTITDGLMHNVWGVLPGRTSETIIVTSHHDAPFKGAVEDGSGVAQVLAQAKIWTRVPREQRERTIVFVIDGGHFYGSLGAYQFTQDHADITRNTKLLLTLEHLGAKEVRERDRAYAETGNLAYTCIFTSPDPMVIATVRNALAMKPPRATISIGSNLLGNVPISDAAGYALGTPGIPVISWIGCPYYLLDEHDTLDKVDKDVMKSICETVSEFIKPYMVNFPVK
nr:M28 family peptidase [Candidatus Sigynarchaeum springense]